MSVTHYKETISVRIPVVLLQVLDGESAAHKVSRNQRIVEILAEHYKLDDSEGFW